jgi:hypothetical protein
MEKVSSRSRDDRPQSTREGAEIKHKVDEREEVKTKFPFGRSTADLYDHSWRSDPIGQWLWIPVRKDTRPAWRRSGVRGGKPDA